MDIMKRLREHYDKALELYNEKDVVGIFVQGSQNYGLDYENSDLDTKLVLLPTFRSIVSNMQPISTTYILENDEHIDLKDIRLYMQTFLKQNPSYLEILFTKYYIINPLYEEEWNRLIENRELIARANPYRGLKALKGMAMEKYHAMEHRYPSKAEIIDKYGYDGKQVHHLLRLTDFAKKYIAGVDYAECMLPDPLLIDRLLKYKKQEIPYEIAAEEAYDTINALVELIDEECTKYEDALDPQVSDLLSDITYNIMLINLKNSVF